MVNAMFAVLIAGSIGYVLSGWVGVAVGATIASAVAVLTEALTPPIERGTSHERRMRRDRRYRARYEAIEDSWRRPYPRSRREWQRATQPAGKKPAVAGPAPADPMLVAIDEPELPSHRAGLHRPGAAPGRLETSWSQRTRGDIESRFRSSLVEREVDQQAGASKRKWPAQARGQSIASTVGWYSTRVADSQSVIIRPREVPGRTRHPADPRHRTSQGGGCRPP